MDADMWSTERCDMDCQCDGLITENFRINAGRSGGKRRLEHTNMSTEVRSPLARSLNRSPYLTPSQRTVLGRVENSPRRSGGKVSRLVDDRRRFTMDKENLPDNFQRFRKAKEPGKCQRSPGTKFPLQAYKSDGPSELYPTESSEFFSSESQSFFREGASGPGSPVVRGHALRKMKSLSSWTLAQVSGDSPDAETPSALEELSSDSGYPPSVRKLSPLPLDESTLDFTYALPALGAPCASDTYTTGATDSRKCDTRVPGTEPDEDIDFETLHDLEEEFETDNFDKCTNYEIISTDSPNIISRGSTARKVTSRNLVFGAPIAETERSTSFNGYRANPSATRMLNFDEEPSFEFASPALRPAGAAASVKKALTFETPSLRHESDSSIGSMSSSPVSTRGDEPRGRLRLFNSESTNSMESGFMSEIEDTFLFDADTEFSSPKVANFGDLLSGQIRDRTLLAEEEIHTEMELEDAGTPVRPSLQRSLSLNPDASSVDRVRMSLFKSSLESPTEVKLRGFKRPEPPLAAAEEDGQSKRRRSNCGQLVAKRPVLQRALSENAASIMSALARSASNPDLIGDFSLPYALPLTSGHHGDLKSISCETLAGLLAGCYGDTVRDFQVIDCRYPYEYEGGHIRGARNLFTAPQVLQLAAAAPASPPPATPATSPPPRAGRSILVFHCEFSLERGPKLSRLLRSADRANNKDTYPALRHPEVYLLHGGYAAFQRGHGDLCAPRGYTPMLHPAHRAELAALRSADERAPRGKCRTRL